MRTKILLGVFSAFSVFALLVIYVLSSQIIKVDVSLNKTIYQPTTSSKHLVWLMSYADGDPVYIANQRAQMVSAFEKGFDVYLPYRRHHLDEEFVKTYSHILKQARGAGYWLWKPYLILKTLKMMPEGDVLIYIDVGAMLRQGMQNFVEIAEKEDIVLFYGGHNNRRYLKRDAAIHMNMDHDKYLDQEQLYSGFLVLKNTSKTRKFIEEWFELCKKDELITNAPSKHAEYPDLIEHRHDQALLTLAYMKNPIAYVHKYEAYPQIDKDVCDLHRRRPRGISKSLFGNKMGLWPQRASEEGFLVSYFEKFRAWVLNHFSDLYIEIPD